jgi:hypothetical protein
MAGKYNDGDPANRPVLGARLFAAIREAWSRTDRRPLRQMTFRKGAINLVPRKSAGFSMVSITCHTSTEQGFIINYLEKWSDLRHAGAGFKLKRPEAVGSWGDSMIFRLAWIFQSS